MMKASIPCLLLSAVAAFPKTEWQAAMPFRDDGAGFHYHDGSFIVNGKSLTLSYRSADGLSWSSLRDTGLSLYTYVTRVVRLEGGFHAFSSTASTYFTSSDGMHWTAASSPSGAGFHDMAFGNGTFVGLSRQSDSAGSAAAVSPDGKTWTRFSTGNKIVWNRVCFGNGIFVAMNERGPIAVSATGSDWDVVQEKNYQSSSMRNLELAYGNGVFVILAESGHVLTSSDGRAWKDTVALGNDRPSSLLFAEGQFLATNRLGDLYRSRDASAWSAPIRISNEPTSVAYGDGRYLAIGKASIAYSIDSASSWTRIPVRTESYLNDAAYAGDRFIVVGRQGALATSPDGLAWSAPWTGVTTALMAVAHGNQRTVVAGYGGTLLVSRDLRGWSTIVNPKWDFSDIAFGDSVFAAVTRDGKIFASPDGESWDSAYSSPLDNRLSKVAYGNGIFIATGSAFGTLLWSADGRQWNRTVDTTIKESLEAFIGCGPDGFILGGDDSRRVETLYRTSDGKTIQPFRVPNLSDLGSELQLRSHAYGQGYHVITGFHFTTPILLYSKNGIDWTLGNEGIHPSHGLVYGGGAFLGLGSSLVGSTHVTSNLSPSPAGIHPQRPWRNPRGKTLIFAAPGAPGTSWIGAPGTQVFTPDGKAIRGPAVSQGMYLLLPSGERKPR